MIEGIANFVTNWRFECGVIGVLLSSYFVGYFVKWALDWMTGQYKLPIDADKDDWAIVVEGTAGFSDRGVSIVKQMEQA